VEEAERVLTGLRKLGLQPGDKVIFQLDRNQDFISVFWGCVFGGFIPVPQSIAPTFQQVNGTVSKLRNAWKLIDPRVVVSSSILTSAIRSATELPQAEGFRVEAIDDVRVLERTQYWHVSRPDDLALLLLTSGSTESSYAEPPCSAPQISCNSSEKRFY
jgi:acyl-CoA synthetase (AMP-forming)/AMP-acid ligase II